MSNQCQGCQAGWEVEESKLIGSDGKPLLFHVVRGGYPGEMAICTKHHYSDSKPQCWEGGSKDMCDCPDCGRSLIQIA